MDRDGNVFVGTNAGGLVQSRLEAATSIQKRQADDFNGVLYDLREILSRLRGTVASDKETSQKVEPPASGLIESLERGLRDSELVIESLRDIERELRSYI